MFAALGYRVAALRRVREGSLVLGGLAEGGVRELGDQEIRKMFGDR
jgi:16S rRNA U516 pseudouridylate synthase RsuA-like enzyme